MRRILICGSRTYSESHDADPMGAILRDWIDEEPTIIHGAARGADSLAASWAEQLGYSVEAFPADWVRHGRRAGYVRNQQMLDEGRPDVVYAFVDKPLAESRGTAMMAELARKAGVRTIVIEVR